MALGGLHNEGDLEQWLKQMLDRLGVRAARPTPPLLTYLPANAPDGYVVDFVPDGNTGVVWRLRYNAASTSAYKWELVGGSPVERQEITSTSGIGTVAVLDTNVPAYTIPLAGDYMITMGARFDSVASGNQNIWTLGPSSVTALMTFNQRNSPEWGEGSRTKRVNAIAAATALNSYVNGTVAGGRQLDRRYQVVPVRVG